MKVRGGEFSTGTMGNFQPELTCSPSLREPYVFLTALVDFSQAGGRFCKSFNLHHFVALCAVKNSKRQECHYETIEFTQLKGCHEVGEGKTGGILRTSRKAHRCRNPTSFSTTDQLCGMRLLSPTRELWVLPGAAHLCASPSNRSLLPPSSKPQLLRRSQFPYQFPNRLFAIRYYPQHPYLPALLRYCDCNRLGMDIQTDKL
jgi:hypothetical protein